VQDKVLLPLMSTQASAVTAALDSWLTRHPLRRAMRSARLELVVGMPHVRYLLLPWDRQLVLNDFRQAMARALYTRQFREEFSLQELRFGALIHGRPLLAVGIDRTLVRAVAAVAHKHAASGIHIEPLLATVWNRFYPQLKEGGGTLLLAEPSRLLVIRRQAGAIIELQVRPSTDADIPALAQRLTTDAGGRIFAPRYAGLAESLPSVCLGLTTGKGFSTSADAAYAYALCGVF
jgi:hypothetical protein